MTIATVAVVDVTNPIEVQAWLDSHLTITLFAMWNNGTTFFIVYS